MTEVVLFTNDIRVYELGFARAELIWVKEIPTTPPHP